MDKEILGFGYRREIGSLVVCCIGLMAYVCSADIRGFVAWMMENIQYIHDTNDDPSPRC